MSRTGKLEYDDISAKVSDNRLREVEVDFPPVSKRQSIVFREYLTLNGEGSSFDMIVDGTTPQEFSITSSEDSDIYINSLCFFISAENVIADLNEFGSAPALANGCSLYYVSQDAGTIIIDPSISTNNDLLRLGGYKPSFGNLSGTGNRPFLMNNVFSNADNGYMPVIRLVDYGYEPEYRGGIRLRKKSADKIVFQINDDLSAFTASQLFVLNCIAYGFSRII